MKPIPKNLIIEKDIQEIDCDKEKEYFYPKMKGIHGYFEEIKDNLMNKKTIKDFKLSQSNYSKSELYKLITKNDKSKVGLLFHILQSLLNYLKILMRN